MSIAAPLRNLYHRSPSVLQRAILVRRREAIWRKAGIVFVHIPKAAGTSINLALYGQFMGHVRARDIRLWGSAAVNALPSFAVTRNPWDRLVSAYRFARRGSGIGGDFQAAVHRPEQYRVPEFASFERFVTDWLSKREIAKLDGIFQPQCAFVCGPDEQVLVDHLGRVEDLGATIDFIRRHAGTVPPFDRSNRSGAEIDYRSFYTPQLVDLVGDIYWQDVRTFGYDF